MPTVKKQGSSWYFCFNAGKYASGKVKQIKRRGFKTKKTAEIALNEMLNAYNKGDVFQESTMLYKDFLDKWFETKKTSISYQTIPVYQHYKDKKVIPELGGYPLSKLTAVHIQDFVNKLYNDGLSPASVRKIFIIVRNSLEHAQDLQLVRKNVATKIILPKITKTDFTIWTREEMRRFLDTAKSDSYYMIFLLALSTGMRQSELFGLRWKDIDLDKGILSIRQILAHDGKTFLNEGKTKSSLRSIPLSLNTISSLKAHEIELAKQKMSLGLKYKNHDLVLCTSVGTPICHSNARKHMVRILKKANVPAIRFHDMRHTHASLLLEDGINVKVVSERLGHANIKITLDTYAHSLPTMQQEALKALDEMFF